jgi:hypothetical protein
MSEPISFSFQMEKPGVDLIIKGLMKLPIEEAQGFLQAFVDAANKQIPVAPLSPVESVEEAGIEH